MQAKAPLYPDYLRGFAQENTPILLIDLTSHGLAHYDPLEKVEPVGEFEHDDPGHRAHPSMQNLLKDAINVFELSPHCGTELQGVQIVGVAALVG